ncbi:MAG: hypothetical protein AAGI30_12435 [Planctomycetota bacterium]
MRPTHSRSTDRLVAGLLVFAGLAIAAPANGEGLFQASDPDPGMEVLQTQDQASGASYASLSLGVDWYSAYYFRGIIQEDDGFIAQPYVELGLTLFETEESAVYFAVGIWNSIHSEIDTAGDDGFEEWYELDVYASAGITFGDWDVSVTYTNYSSPSDAFQSIDEIGVGIAYSDSFLPGDFSLNPYIYVASEIGENGALGGPGIYMELGIEPTIYEPESGPLEGLSMSFPVTLGLGFDDYFAFSGDNSDNEDTFGFVQFGVSASYPLPIDWGDWAVSAGVYGLYLGESLEDLNQDDEDIEVLGTVGLSVSF